MMTTETSGAAKTAGLGEILAESRKANRLTIERVAEALHVSGRILAKIEAGDYEHLPPDAFLRGIIKRYAAFLGLDPRAAVEQYIRESGWHAVRTSGPADLLPANRFSGQRRYWSFGAKELAVLVSAAAFFYLVWQVSWFVRPPSIDLDGPVGDTIVTHQAAFVVSGTLRGAKRVMINGARIGADADGRFSHQIELRKGENTIELRAEDARGKVTTLRRRILYQPAD
jgi:transcriptional regulator with XRE-family HTH domain